MLKPTPRPAMNLTGKHTIRHRIPAHDWQSMHEVTGGGAGMRNREDCGRWEMMWEKEKMEEERERWEEID